MVLKELLKEISANKIFILNEVGGIIKRGEYTFLGEVT